MFKARQKRLAQKLAQELAGKNLEMQEIMDCENNMSQNPLFVHAQEQNIADIDVNLYQDFEALKLHAIALAKQARELNEENTTLKQRLFKQEFIGTGRSGQQGSRNKMLKKKKKAKGKAGKVLHEHQRRITNPDN